MFDKIVIGFDGLDGGDDALVLARMLAAPETELILVHAYPFEDLPSRATELDYEGLVRADAEKLLTAAAPKDRPATLVSVADLSPARALHHVAEEHGADLLVIGSCRRSVLGRVLAGDVSRAVLHGAPCAVAIAPREYRQHAHKVGTIGVGYNDSPEARAALAFAAEAAAALGASLRVLSAAPAPAPYVPGFASHYDMPDVRERRRLHAQQALEQAVATLELPAAPEMIAEAPGKALEDLSRHVELIVAGSRGWGAARRVVLGSTTDHLAHHAACPVIVVPGPAYADDGAGAAHEELPSHA